jgi:hypothetical protein
MAQMLKAIALGIAAGIVLAGPASAQPLAPPALDAGQHVILVKKDKDKHDNGRKLGHYKHRNHDDDNGDRFRRWSSSRGGNSWPYAAQRYYDRPSYSNRMQGYGDSWSPGYGSSRPPAYFAPPAFYGMPY